MCASRNSSVAAGFLQPMSNDIRNQIAVHPIHEVADGVAIEGSVQPLGPRVPDDGRGSTDPGRTCS
jgi:hypothetical protein